MTLTGEKMFPRASLSKTLPIYHVFSPLALFILYLNIQNDSNVPYLFSKRLLFCYTIKVTELMSTGGKKASKGPIAAAMKMSLLVKQNKCESVKPQWIANLQPNSP